MVAVPRLPYAGSGLDRGGSRRGDERWIVRREVAEETGVMVSEVGYQGSQPWPFPSGIMIGFRARALTEAIEVDGDELEEAHWLTEGD